MDLSIIVPLAPNEHLDSRLLIDLKAQKSPDKLELILVSLCEATCMQNLALAKPLGIPVRTVTATVKQGGDNLRATCLNTGASVAECEWLLFCHADSFFQNDFVKPLAHFVGSGGAGLAYFNLKFIDGSPLMVLNTWGVNFRCHFLKTPFGDQGLFMSKRTWQMIGQFPLHAAYGEDHLLVRQAKALGMPIRSLGMPIYTSARKYVTHGWLKTTLKHQWLWYLQIYQDRQGRR